MEKANPHDMNFYADLERSLKTLLSLIRPPLAPTELTDFYLYIDQGEYGLAFDEIVSALDERPQSITLQVYDFIDKLGNQMELQPQNWKHLQDVIVKAK